MDLQTLLSIDYPETRWRIHSLLPAEGVAVLGGLPKAGKSLLSNQQALCIAAGIPFLDQQTVQARVLLIEAEGSLAAFQDRLRCQSEALGIEGDIPLFAPRDAPKLRLGTPEGRDRLDAWIRDRRPDVVILGPLAQLYAPEDENAAHEMGKVVTHLIDVSQEHKLVIQLSHHFIKGAKTHASGGTWFDAFRGSSALVSGCDAALGIERRPNDASGGLMLLQRDGFEEPIPFRFDARTLLFVRSEASLRQQGQTGWREQARHRSVHPDDGVCQGMLSVLREDPQAEWSAPGIGARVEKSKNTARQHLDALTEQGLLVKRQRGSTYRYGLPDTVAAG